MSSTPNLIVPGRHDRERRVYGISCDGLDVGVAVTTLVWAIDSFIMGAAGTVNPGFPTPALATGLFLSWAVAAHNVAGNWTVSLHRNEGAAVATFVMVAAAAGVQSKLFGQWSTIIRFDAGDTWHLTAAGPEKNFVIARAILRFEEIR